MRFCYLTIKTTPVMLAVQVRLRSVKSVNPISWENKRIFEKNCEGNFKMVCNAMLNLPIFLIVECYFWLYYICICLSYVSMYLRFSIYVNTFKSLLQPKKNDVVVWLPIRQLSISDQMTQTLTTIGHPAYGLQLWAKPIPYNKL